MPTPTPVTAVFDIGKTNKKFFLFDENYSVIEEYKTVLDQTEDDDGTPCEDLEKLESWINEKINDAFRNNGIQIRVLNFSTYGASFVHLDKYGKAVTPLYNYLKSYPEALLSNFYQAVGGREKFSLETASPPMGMLNSGLQLYWLKHQKPELFDKIDTTLHFPNYLSYLFSGKKISELTSIGCHTGLWNFETMKYHNWLEDNEVNSLLPQIQDVKNKFRGENGVSVGTGIHDSSAALAPYLIGLDDPFMLISTGTWSITFNPFNAQPLSYAELKRDCLCYLDIYGSQVKSSRFFLGSEYDHQKKKIEKYFDVSIEDKEMEPDVSLLNELAQRSNPEFKLQLEPAHHSGPFPQDGPGDWAVDQFSSHKAAYHQLMLDLASIQTESVRLVEGFEEVDKLIITGGFSRNRFFASLLASFFPGKKIYTSSLPDASALGAALVMDQQSVPEDLKRLLGLNLHSSLKGLDITQYSWRK